MSINGLEETKGDPDVNGEDMEVAREVAPEQGTGNSSSAEDHDFSWVSVLCGKTEGCRVLVVDLVNVLVEHGGMEKTVGEVVEHVLEEEEERDLGDHGFP